MLPVSALLTNALESRSGTALFDTLQTTPVVFGAGVVEDPRAGALRDAGDLEQILRDASPGFEEAEVLEVRGGHLFVRGSDGLVAAAAEIVRGLQDTWLRTVRVEATTTLHPAPAGDELFASGGRGAEGVLHRVTFPALLGRTHVVARGTETTGIRDYDVEIAQKAAVANAIVEGVFSGVAVEAFVHAGLRDTGAEVDIGLVYVPEPRRRAVEMREGGDRFVAAPRRAFFRHAGGVSPGEVIDLGEGPIVEVHGQSFRTRQHLRIGPR